MSRRTRTAVLAAAAVAVLVALPSSAGAAYTTPTAVDFGNVPVGTPSGPQDVTLVAECTTAVVVICPTEATDLVNVNPSVTGDFVLSHSCPAGLGPNLIDGTSQSCPISVIFIPGGPGPQAGTLNIGTMGPGGLLPAPTVALSGNGLASTASSPSGTGSTTPRHRKCKKKKKRAAQSAKKRRCKKKRR